MDVVLVESPVGSVLDGDVVGEQVDGLARLAPLVFHVLRPGEQLRLDHREKLLCKQNDYMASAFNANTTEKDTQK